MPEPQPDPRLRKVMIERDELREQLRIERVRSGNLRAALKRVQAGLAQDAKPVQAEQRAG